MKERNALVSWIKEHKNELIITGISIGALILFVLSIIDQETIKETRCLLKKAVKHPTAKVSETVTKIAAEMPSEFIQEDVTAVVSKFEPIPFMVSRHIRNLPDGRHASPEKIAEALKNNILISDGQTWVESYMKRNNAA